MRVRIYLHEDPVGHGRADLLRTAHCIGKNQTIAHRYAIPIDRADARPRVRADTRTVVAIVDGRERRRVTATIPKLTNSSLPERGTIIGDCRKA